ncbi:hypothetical protein J2X48_000691 [Bosea sp. BE271]|uniref:hypothetical protein n=1 Tax=Bosea TaxID=85413 RepID=UPI00285B7A3F|nr:MULTISPECIES: hypothetical protein [Bosea]MDR6826505.1 hypothetical protein [Bosea robiniae]MDR6893215.1 hypothetical protein [Bosea sp. BE109]MDR7137086.1 hypothetical protein [Bosea sp. BE168]MDR7173785.1 hypothetical protein [Bosea sp. BE271]
MKIEDTAIEKLARTMANAKLGEGDSVRCEGPTEFEINQARPWARRALASLSPAATPVSEAGPVAYLQTNGGARALVDASRRLDDEDRALGWTETPLYTLAKPSPAGGDEIARWKRDSELLSAIQDECWDVRFTNSPNADAGDYNVNIEIVGHFMADPQERVVGENYNENLRAALEQAMTAEPYPPARPIYEEPDEPEDAAILAAIDTGQKESQP